MSTFQKLRNSKLLRFVWIGNTTLVTKKHEWRRLGSHQVRLLWTMNQVWQFFLSATVGDNKLKIWQTSDNDGNTWWHGCDRATGRSTCVATEDEMRAWIDRHYYQ
jgi:hypothetical protein